MKPIESGCRARIINCKNELGLEVDVIQYYGNNLPFLSDHTIIWVIDKPVTYDDGDSLFLISEYYLQRIDDYDGNKKISWDQMKDIWVPEHAGCSSVW